jgi:tRNA pseudouridine38-40 synthase
VADHPVRVSVAGRTDRGVHAAGQIVHFDSTAKRSEQAWVMGANSHLNKYISVLWAKSVSDEFHARFSAIRRAYRYVIYMRRVRPAYLRVHWCYQQLDCKKMQEGANYLLGCHDFAAFQASHCQAKTSIRTIHSLQLTQQGNFIFIDIEANAFLYHMVRNIVGTLMEVGANKYAAQQIKTILQGKDRTKAGITVTADGLYLMKVHYPEKFALPHFTPLSAFW